MRETPLGVNVGEQQRGALSMALVVKLLDRGQPVTAPGVPPDYATPDDLITDDCIRP